MKRERMLEEAESVEERIVQYYKKGLAPGIIARLVGSTKENIIKLLQRKGLNVTEEI
jgi:type III secretion system FlhB-like substrate exporter